VIVVRLIVAVIVEATAADPVATVRNSVAAEAASVVAEDVADEVDVTSAKAAAGIYLPPSTLHRKAVSAETIVVRIAAQTAPMTAEVIAATGATIAADVAIPIAAATKIAVLVVILTVAALMLLVLPIRAKNQSCFPASRSPNIAASRLSKLPLP
jgi:hypothetical protein